MELFINSLSDILSYVAGEPIALKSLTQLSTEIAALVGQTEAAWLPYFLAPVNLISLFVYGGLMYAILWIVLYLPWRLFRALIPIGGNCRKRGD